MLMVDLARICSAALTHTNGPSTRPLPGLVVPAVDGFSTDSEASQKARPPPGGWFGTRLRGGRHGARPRRIGLVDPRASGHCAQLGEQCALLAPRVGRRCPLVSRVWPARGCATRQPDLG